MNDLVEQVEDRIVDLTIERDELLARIDQLEAERDDIDHDEALRRVRALQHRFPCLIHTRTYCQQEGTHE